jgi:hypothetical protein
MSYTAERLSQGLIDFRKPSICAKTLANLAKLAKVKSQITYIHVRKPSYTRKNDCDTLTASYYP